MGQAASKSLEPCLPAGRMWPPSNVNLSVIRRFARFLESNRLAHAYLFVGPEDMGKRETALGVAKLLNCEHLLKDMFCEECPSCRKIAKGCHPDIHCLEHEPSEPIRIEQIREMIAQIHLKPFEGEKKVFIVPAIEDLTLEGSNALLKTLEEPTPDSLIILTTSIPEKVLETVQSRCQAVVFSPISQPRLANQLTTDYAINKETSHFLAYFSEGSLSRSLKLQERKFMPFKNEVIDQMVYAPESESYWKNIVADKEKTKEALKVLLSWFRDVMLLKAGGGEPQVVHVDRPVQLEDLKRRYTFEELKEIITEIVKTLERLDENLNVKIALALIKEKLWRRSSKLN